VRSARSLALAGLLLLAAAPAAAEDPIALRLAALRALVTPGAPPPRLAPPAFDASACPEPPGPQTARTRRAIRDASLRYLVDAGLIRSVIRVESAGNPRAVSVKGAMGLMQLMPATARSLGVVCPFDPRENVLGGTRYLRRQRDRFGSWARALAAYHAGPTRVARGRIPAETHRYVRLVLRGWERGRAEAARSP